MVKLPFSAAILGLILNHVHAQVTWSEQAQARGVFHAYSTTNFGGAGLSFADFDGDGWDDLTLASDTNAQLVFYKNVNGTFQPVASPINNLDDVKQPLWIDFDNDGDKDLYTCSYLGVSRLYRNHGNFTFSDITAAANLRLDTMRTYGAAWGDYDRDGWLDLYHTTSSSGYPDTFTNYLYRNLGDGTFQDVTSMAGVWDGDKSTFCPSFLDYDNDNWPDIYTCVDRFNETNAMFHNEHDGTFSDTRASTGTGVSIDAMCVAVGDYNNDGCQDIYVTNGPAGNMLFKNNCDSTFSEVAVAAGVAMYSAAWGAQFFDGDNDMDEDLYVSGSSPGTQLNSSAYYRNLGTGSFVEPSGIGFDADTFRSYGNAFGDVNNDGFLDIAVLNESPDSFNLWLSSGGTNNYLKFDLTGTISNRDAVGARIEVWIDGVRQIRMIHAGLGYLGQNTLRPVVGLDTHSVADSVHVLWPSGQQQMFTNVAANQTFQIIESNSVAYTDVTAWQPALHTYDPTFSELGGGASFVDFNGDGLDDICLATGSGAPAVFYKSLGDSLEQVSLLPANSDTAQTKSLLWGDYDNDSDLDLFLSSYMSGNTLFRNDSGTFVNVTYLAGLSTHAQPTYGASWFDYNRDGYLDLYVINRSFPPNNIYDRNYLFENNGNGTFTERAWAAGVADSGNLPLAVSSVDYNKDRWPDIFIAMDKYLGNKLFRNNGDSTFTDVSSSSGTGLDMDGMCVAQGDADNDGDLDLYVTNEPYSGNYFFRNNGNGTFDTIQTANGTIVHLHGWGANFLDYDNDGWMDLFTVNSDAPSGGSNFRNPLLRNVGNGFYQEVFGAGTDADTNGYSYGTAWGDLNDDGFPDLVVNNDLGTPSRIYRNNGSWNNWIKLKLIGTVSNRNAVGTWIRVVTGTQEYHRYTSAGISYLSQNSFYEIIGTGLINWLDTIEIRWPNGHVDTLTDYPTNQVLTITEGMTVPVNAQIVVTGPQPFCDGEQAVLDAGEFAAYEWSTGDTTRFLAATESGTFSVTVTNEFGFSGAAATSVTFWPNPLVQLTADATLCHGDSTGSVQASVSNGTSPYFYQWSTGATTSQLVNVPADNYSLTVTDQNGCLSSETATVTEPLVLSATLDPADVSCFGGSDGAINATLAGGTQPFFFLWSTGAQTEDISGVGAGCYSVLVTDDNGCNLEDSVCLGEPIPFDISMVITPVACETGTQGAVDLTVTGSNGGYTFAWSNGESTEDLNDVPTGAYTVTITDVRGCNDSAVANVGLTSPIQLSADLQDVSCHGGNDGYVDLTVVGGTTPYSFQWSSSETTEDLVQLAAGSFIVTVTDSAGCTKSLTAEIAQPEQIEFNEDITLPQCYGLTNGSIALNVTGGTPGYAYVWAHGPSSSTINGIGADTFTVAVIDAIGCSADKAFIVDQPDEISASHTVIDANCFGEATGHVDLSVVGGTPPHAFQWSNSATSEDLTNVVAGNYAVTVTDSSGCIFTYGSMLVIEPQQLVCALQASDLLCNGVPTGSIDLTATGGTPPYLFSWSTGDSTEDISQLPADLYSVTVTDFNGCSDTVQQHLQEPSVLSVQLVSEPVACFGWNNGTIVTHPSGGMAPYTYFWSDQSSDKDRLALGVGSYVLTITDSNGCVLTDSAVITEPPAIDLQTSATPDSLSHGVGAATVVASGGTPPFSYLWSDPASQVTATAAGLLAGTYRVWVTDANNCKDSADVEVPMVLGFDRATGSQLRLYPNPAGDFVTLARSEWQPAILTVTDAARKRVKVLEIRNATTRIPTQQLAPGMYWVHIHTPGGKARALKFVVQR